MKIAATIARYLMGLIFTVFGLNGFFHFLPMPPVPPLAQQNFGVMQASHYMVPVFWLQVIGGVLFLVNRYVPLALTLVGPVIVNILMFHILMNPTGIGPGLIVTICWFIVYSRERSAFAGIFRRVVISSGDGRGLIPGV